MDEATCTRPQREDDFPNVGSSQMATREWCPYIQDDVGLWAPLIHVGSLIRPRGVDGHDVCVYIYYRFIKREINVFYFLFFLTLGSGDFFFSIIHRLIFLIY